MEEIIFLVAEEPEGGFTTHALGYSIFTEANTWDELNSAIKDAVDCHFEENKPILIRPRTEYE